jgi:hypothetical protein
VLVCGDCMNLRTPCEIEVDDQFHFPPNLVKVRGNLRCGYFKHHKATEGLLMTLDIESCFSRPYCHGGLRAPESQHRHTPIPATIGCNKDDEMNLKLGVRHCPIRPTWNKRHLNGEWDVKNQFILCPGEVLSFDGVEEGAADGSRRRLYFRGYHTAVSFSCYLESVLDWRTGQWHFFDGSPSFTTTFTSRRPDLRSSAQPGRRFQ